MKSGEARGPSLPRRFQKAVALLVPWPQSLRMRSTGYMDLVRALPRPTREQVEAFLTHLADADNWLKLLPLRGGPEVTVYLDPSAGTRLNRDRDSDRYAVQPLGAADELVHGSELPTDVHRRRFGYLNYHVHLGAGTAVVEAGVMLRALLPEPGIVHAGAFVPLPAVVRATASRPGAFLHGTFRGAAARSERRRFRYAVERLAKLEALPSEDAMVQRLRTWVERCKEEDHAAFDTWLHSAHGEASGTLAEAARWQRYVEWRDEEACMRLHEAQDEAFERTGIPEAIVAEHARALEMVRHSVRTMLDALT